MKFCRSCGSALAASAAPPPMGAPPMAGGAMGMGGMPPAGPMGQPPMGMPPAGPMGMPPGPPPMGGAPIPSSPGLVPSMPPPMAPPMGGMPPVGNAPPPMGGAPMGGSMGGPMGGPTTPGVVKPAGPSGMVACPRCGTQTPAAFAYCQQCGLHMSALQPTDPGAARARTPSSMGQPPMPLSSPPMGVDPQGATLTPSPSPAAQMAPLPAIGLPHSPAGSGARAPTPAAQQPQPIGLAHSPAGSVAAASWGSAILVNRDGSDGQRYPLGGESVVIGREGADIAFADDRFLAPRHARLDRGADGVVKVTAMDALNGVFKKATEPVELVNGSIVLVGREVLQFELVDGEEKTIHPLVRHGVALFGSPPREPWGRLFQVIPNGGHRDVRHLSGDEVILGREDGDIVYRDDAFMSRRHASLSWLGNVARITDLGSSNGTFVRITVATPLKSGDHVRMGDQLLRIELGR